MHVKKYDDCFVYLHPLVYIFVLVSIDRKKVVYLLCLSQRMCSFIEKKKTNKLNRFDLSCIVLRRKSLDISVSRLY